MAILLYKKQDGISGYGSKVFSWVFLRPSYYRKVCLESTAIWDEKSFLAYAPPIIALLHALYVIMILIV